MQLLLAWPAGHPYGSGAALISSVTHGALEGSHRSGPRRLPRWSRRELFRPTWPEAASQRCTTLRRSLVAVRPRGLLAHQSRVIAEPARSALTPPAALAPPDGCLQTKRNDASSMFANYFLAFKRGRTFPSVTCFTRSHPLLARATARRRL